MHTFSSFLAAFESQCQQRGESIALVQDEHSWTYTELDLASVAGIIADSLNKYGGDTCVYEFIAYKTHDRNGVSTLFDVACAPFQSALDDVDIITEDFERKVGNVMRDFSEQLKAKTRQGRPIR